MNDVQLKEWDRNPRDLISEFQDSDKVSGRERVLVLFGSPRLNGTTGTVLRDFLEARNLAADFVHVNRLDIKGCQHCLYCQSHGGVCRYKDDMAGIYELVKNAKKIIMAFPLFYATMPGEFKVMIDRFFAVSDIVDIGGKNTYGSIWPKGRDVFLLVTHGNSIPVVNEGLVRSIKYVCIETNSTLKGWYFSPPTDFFDVAKDKSYVVDMLEAAKDF